MTQNLPGTGRGTVRSTVEGALLSGPPGWDPSVTGLRPAPPPRSGEVL
jgi:hypothetical protein